MALPVMNSACRVTLEYEDGTVFTGVATIAELIIEAPITTFCTENGKRGHFAAKKRWELNLRGIDTPYSHIEMSRKEYREQIIEPARTASEWKCDRCGAVWPREEKKCGACGFWRPFVYE